MPTCTLLISTYNFPKALNLCLKSVLRQTHLPSEILIADDGSGQETISLIDEYKKLSPVPIIHAWHEDKGFRKTIILNKALKQASADYIVQVDGDIILSRSFIKDHLAAAKPGYFIRGSRTLLTAEKTKALMATGIINVNFLSAGVINRLNAFPSGILSAINAKAKDQKDILNVIGANTSYWRSDFIRINGFNNDITGWGKEDGELAARLLNAGVLKLSLKHRAICFHLDHLKSSREKDETNTEKMMEALRNKIAYAANGFQQV